MFFKDFVSVKRKKIKKGASQTYDTPSFPSIRKQVSVFFQWGIRLPFNGLFYDIANVVKQIDAVQLALDGDRIKDGSTPGSFVRAKKHRVPS